MCLPFFHTCFNVHYEVFFTIRARVANEYVCNGNVSFFVRNNICYIDIRITDNYGIFMLTVNILVFRITTILTFFIPNIMGVHDTLQRNFLIVFVTAGFTFIIALSFSANSVIPAIDGDIFQLIVMSKRSQTAFVVCAVEKVTAIFTFTIIICTVRTSNRVWLFRSLVYPNPLTIVTIVPFCNFTDERMPHFINICVIAVQNFPMPILILMLTLRIDSIHLRCVLRLNGFLRGLIGVRFVPRYVIRFFIGFAIGFASGFRFRIIRRFGFRFLRRFFLLVPFRSFFLVFGFRFQIRFGR